jgi:hypothetical protein
LTIVALCYRIHENNLPPNRHLNDRDKENNDNQSNTIGIRTNADPSILSGNMVFNSSSNIQGSRNHTTNTSGSSSGPNHCDLF